MDSQLDVLIYRYTWLGAFLLGGALLVVLIIKLDESGALDRLKRRRR